MTPTLSVVLAVSNDATSVAEPIAALARGCSGVTTELIIVHSGVAMEDPSGFDRMRVVACESRALMPNRWGAGARIATGRVVAFTTDQMRVSDGWALALLDRIDAGAVGVGGPIALATGADRATAAAHLVRFSAFLPGAHRACSVVKDVAGDNAAYTRAAVVEHTDLLHDGFWEVEFHRRFEHAGGHLEMEPTACATLHGPVSTRALLWQRFQHAREFGRARVRDHHESRWRIVIAAPLVPFVLLRRLSSRARRDAAIARGVPSLWPRLLALTTAWAVGEAVGAIRASPSGT